MVQVNIPYAIFSEKEWSIKKNTKKKKTNEKCKRHCRIVAQINTESMSFKDLKHSR